MFGDAEPCLSTGAELCLNAEKPRFSAAKLGLSDAKTCLSDEKPGLIFLRL